MLHKHYQQLYICTKGVMTLANMDFSRLVLYWMIYSILGWVCEVVYCSIPAKKFINRGFLNGPYCPIYGVGAVLVLHITTGISDAPLLVFLLSLCAASVLEYVTSWLMEAFFQARWWDYSHMRFQLNGRICLLNSLLFGMMGMTLVCVLQPRAESLIAMIPNASLRVLSSILTAAFLIDLVYSLNSLLKLTERLKMLHNYLLETEELNFHWLDRRDWPGSIARLKEICIENAGTPELIRILDRLEGIMDQREWSFRLTHSFPHMRLKGFDIVLTDLRDAWEKHKKELSEQTEALRQGVRDSSKQRASALVKADVSFYNLFWVFVTASVLGYVVETIYCLITRGMIESRQGLLYGPFSQIYGFGAVLMVVTLSPLMKKNDRWVFGGSALIGGAFEYICSYLQESIFGTVSWEYSQHAFSIGGRTSLTYMFFWGVLGLVFMKGVYPVLNVIVKRISKYRGSIVTRLFILLLGIDIILSATAVYRWSKRYDYIPAANAYEAFLDRQYPDELLDEIYPNMTRVENR